MTITRERVQAAADDLAVDGWNRREEPGELERVSEIRQLAASQLADDTYNIGGEVYRKNLDDGRTARVITYGEKPRDTDGVLSSQITEQQLQLEYGFQPLLDEWLTTDKMDLVRWTHAAQLSVRQIADIAPRERINGVLKSPSYVTISRRIKAVHGEIRARLQARFPEATTVAEVTAALVERGRVALVAERALRQGYRRR